MPASSKRSVSSKPSGRRKSLKEWRTFFVMPSRVRNFLARRPHRSFRLTRRRDYTRKLALPGYIAFAHEVNTTVWHNKKLLVPLALIFSTAYIISVGFVSQENYSILSDVLQASGEDVFAGFLGTVQHAGLLLASTASSTSTLEAEVSQQLIASVLLMLLWLTTVWLLRNRMAGRTVRLRDGLYNAGAPLLPSVLLFLVIVAQLLPIALAAMGYYAASATNLLASGGPAMMFWLGASLLGILSLYWVTSTLFATIIVTLPGMYPMQALRTAGDMVLGRRVRILLRWLFMALCVAFFWAIVMIPMVLLEVWLRSYWLWMEDAPLIPIAVVVMGAISVVWVATYIYVLYRKVVDSAA